jgi:hypothetical protein
MPAFMRLNLKPGVSPAPPPAGEAPPWMAKRPAGISAFVQTFKTYDLDPEALRAFRRPVYYALGGLSNPDQFGEISTRLGQMFPISHSKCSTSATTSTRHTVLSPKGSRTRYERSGSEPNAGTTQTVTTKERRP